MKIPVALPICLLVLPLAGCNLSPTASSSGLPIGQTVAGMSHGSLHGGQQPVVGAKVFVFAAGNTGYGSASVSILANIPGATNVDNTAGSPTFGDYYTLTDSKGNFDFDNSCPANREIYVYASGGNPGSGENSNVGMLSIIGQCSGNGSLAGFPSIGVDEVSTIAAAYAFSGFAVDATHVGSTGNQQSLIGLDNAFATSGNLSNISTGLALATTPAGNGTVPQAEINTLGNILASCVNSAPPFANCTTLETNATNGSTVPTETATAAINIAHNPASNVAALYPLSNPTAPFQPSLSAPPSDFTIAIAYGGGGQQIPNSVAIDASGQVWIANNGADVLTALSPLGVPLSGNGYGDPNQLNFSNAVAVDPAGSIWVGDSNGKVAKFKNDGTPITGSPYTGGGLSFVAAIAIDGAGDLFAANNDTGTITKLANNGTALSPAGGYKPAGLTFPNSIAIDQNTVGSNLFVTDTGTTPGTLYKLANNGTSLATTTGGFSVPSGIAIDSSNKSWVSSVDTNALAVFTDAGALVATYTGGGLNSPSAVAIDGLGQVYASNQAGNSVSKFSNAGVPISPANGFTSSTLSTPASIAVDPSGNVWLTNFYAVGSKSGGTTTTEFVGLGAPVVTPLSRGILNNTLATRP